MESIPFISQTGEASSRQSPGRRVVSVEPNIESPSPLLLIFKAATLNQDRKVK
jgi:hypothetical protein